MSFIIVRTRASSEFRGADVEDEEYKRTITFKIPHKVRQALHSWRSNLSCKLRRLRDVDFYGLPLYHDSKLGEIESILKEAGSEYEKIKVSVPQEMRDQFTCSYTVLRFEPLNAKGASDEIARSILKELRRDIRGIGDMRDASKIEEAVKKIEGVVNLDADVRKLISEIAALRTMKPDMRQVNALKNRVKKLSALKGEITSRNTKKSLELAEKMIDRIKPKASDNLDDVLKELAEVLEAG